MLRGRQGRSRWKASHPGEFFFSHTSYWYVNRGTYDVVVLAANGMGVAAALADTNDGDRSAGSTNKRIQGAHDDAKEPEEGSDGSSCIGLVRYQIHGF